MALLDCLDDIDWAKLSHAYGPATDVPGLLRALVDPATTVKERKRLQSALYGNVVHQGTVWSSSSKVVPFFVGIAIDGSIDIELRRFALQYILDLSVDENIEPGDFDPDEYFADVEDPGTWREEDRGTEDDKVLEQMVWVWAKACYEAVEARVPELLRLVEDPDDDLCFKVLGLLAAFPRCASQTVPALRTLVKNPDADSERRDAAAETIALLESDQRRSG
jgi:hypothetical protein